MIPLIALAIAGCGRSSPHAVRAYVSNEADGTVSVIDTSAQKVIATIPVGKRPRGLHVSRNGAYLYVALSGSPRGGPSVDESTLPPPDRAADGIAVVDLAKLKLVRTIASGQDPESFDLVGKDEIVVSNAETAEVSIVDLEKGAVRAKLPTGREPGGVTTDPDGKLVYVASASDSTITVIDPRATRVVATIPTGARPRGIAFSRDGERAYVADEGDGTVTVIDTKAKTQAEKIQLPRDGSAVTGPRPMGVAIAPGAHRVYVTTGRGGSVAVIDPETSTVVRVISNVGPLPRGIAAGPDGKLYTANGSSNDVSIIDPDDGTVIARVEVGASPWGIALDAR